MTYICPINNLKSILKINKMKTSHFFSLIIVSLAIGSSILVQDIALTNKMNQASLFSFTEKNSIPAGEVQSVSAIVNGFMLPVVKVDGKLMPHLVLQEVNIEGKLDRKNVYPTRLLNGKHVASVMLNEVNIFSTHKF